jgi:hypothetical protein
MKVDIKTLNDIIKNREFPLLMENLNNPEILVSFLNLDEGVVIQHPTRSFGNCYSDWEPCNNAKVWKVFKGTIELSND